MMPRNNFQSPVEEKEYPNNEKFEIEYTINLTPQLFAHFEKFCEILDLTQYEFIDDLLDMYLKEIPSGLNTKNYYPVVRYYNFSVLLENKIKDANGKHNENSNQKITIRIQKEINYMILKVCKILRKVKPQKFIEEAIQYEFNAILENIEREEYEFLEELNSLSGRINQLKDLTLELK
ncbi:MAG: hypothetical protein ACFFCV_11535 [Promethearchaeota archaeon]